MSWGAVIVGGASLVGGMMSSNAAGDAADQQSASSQQATQAQMMAAAQMRQDLAPWTSSGGAAQSRLNQYLGIGGAGTGAVTSMGLGTGLTPDQVRQQLLSRYTSTSTPAASTTPHYTDQRDAINQLGLVQGIGAWQDQLTGNGTMDNPWLAGAAPTTAQPVSTVDEAGLNAAIQQYYAEQDALNAKAASDPTYGSLLTPFHNGQEFSFTGDDLQNSPGYQFGLQQGTQGINNAQAARGNFLSGAAMKELDRYNNDYAGTKFNDAFNQAQSTYNTNLGAYNNNRNSIYNYLTGVSTTGENAAARVGAGSQQAANQVSNNLTSAGNSQAAGTIAGSNALVGGINGAANAFNSSSNLNSAAGWNSLLSNSGGGYSGYTGYTGNGDTLGTFINGLGSK